MKYLVLFNCPLNFDGIVRKSRCFSDLETARAYVWDLHGQDWDSTTDEFKVDEEWEEARLFAIEDSGMLTPLSRYVTTETNERGETLGWRDV